MGKLAGVISYDENVKNQFKYTNTIGYTNRTGPRPLILGAAPSARLAPPVPPAKSLVIIKESIDKIGALFKAVNVPEFATTFREAFDDLYQALINEGLITEQTPDKDPLKDFLNQIQETAVGFSKTPHGTILPDDEKKHIDDNFDLYFGYISAMYSQKTTGASGVGETKGAGKFMHSYHAKRFL